MRCWWLLGLVWLPALAWSGEPLVSGLPEPEIAWILEGSALGVAREDPNQLLFQALELPIRVTDLPGVDLGIDLDYGRRLLEEPLQVEIVRPESLVGL